MTKYRIVKDGNGRYFVEEYAFVMKKDLKPSESFYSNEREWQKCTKCYTGGQSGIVDGGHYGGRYIPNFITQWGARRFVKKLMKQEARQDKKYKLSRLTKVIEEYGDV